MLVGPHNQILWVCNVMPKSWNLLSLFIFLWLLHSFCPYLSNVHWALEAVTQITYLSLSIQPSVIFNTNQFMGLCKYCRQSSGVHCKNKLLWSKLTIHSSIGLKKSYLEGNLMGTPFSKPVTVASPTRPNSLKSQAFNEVYSKRIYNTTYKFLPREWTSNLITK